MKESPINKSLKIAQIYGDTTGKNMRRIYAAKVLPVLAALMMSSVVSAQVQTSGKILSLHLATEIAQEALSSCEKSGYKVSVSIVDVSGVERIFLRGDHSTIHTRETAFKKAYTVATLGPIFNSDTTSSLNERIGKTASGPALSTVSNIILLAGGVAIRSGSEVIGAVGVGGAPGGTFDEVCAQAGIAKVQEQIHDLAVGKLSRHTRY